MDNLVSVILPVYNGEKFLKKSIDSVLNQSYNNFELIIINDGSTDRSDLIINKYLPNDKIKYFSRENEGLVATLNEAIERSNGRFIARMDQDDICYPTRIQKQLDFLVKYNIDVCGSSYEIIDEQGKIKNIINSFNEFFEIIISAGLVPFAHPSVMFKNIFRNYKLKYGNKKTTFAEDYDLWIKMIKNDFKFGNVQQVLIQYRDYGDSLSKVTKGKIFIEVYDNCRHFNKKNKKKLILAYNDLFSKSTHYTFYDVAVRSILNFTRFNGFNLIAIKILLKIGIKHFFLGSLKFIKKEIMYQLYIFKIKK